jgi:hypothetical protein
MLRYQIFNRKTRFGHTGIVVIRSLRNDVINLVGNHARHCPSQDRAAHGNVQRLQKGTQSPDKKAAIHLEIRKDTIADNGGIAQRLVHWSLRRKYRQCVHGAGTRKRAHDHHFKIFGCVIGARPLPCHFDGSRLQQPL